MRIGRTSGQKRHPLLLALDIVIVVLTFSLAVCIAVSVRTVRERASWRLSPDNYSYSLQSGDYRSLMSAFYGSYSSIEEEQITGALVPYAAIGRYYRDAFLLGVYRTMDDPVRAQATEQALAAARREMGVYLPEADKIDKIFDIN